MLQTFNAEFRRNLWLEFTWFRIIAFPAILGLLIYIRYRNNADWADDIGEMCLTGIIIIGGVWGTYKAASSVIEEIRDKTWDFQKMSALGAFELALGKLFGSTAYCWYGVALLYVPFAFAFQYDGNLNGETSLIKLSFVSIGGILIAQILALLFSLQNTADNVIRGKVGVFGYQFISLFFTSWFISALMELTEGNMELTEGNSFTVEASSVSWHSLSIDGDMFLFLSILFILFWGGVGLYRSMRSELQFKSAPVVWAVFLITFCIYISGFFEGLRSVDRLFKDDVFNMVQLIQFAVAGTILSFFTYATVFNEAAQTVRYKKLFSHISAQRWRAAFENTPLWIVSLIFMVFCYIMLMSSSLTLISGRLENAPYYISSFLTAALLFVVRDIGIIHYFQTSRRNKRATLSIIVAAVVLYGLMPALFSVASSPDLLAFFYPVSKASPVAALLPVSLQVVFVWILVLRRWRGQAKH